MVSKEHTTTEVVVVEIFASTRVNLPLWYDPTLITPAIGPTSLGLFRFKIIRRGAPLYPALVPALSFGVDPVTVDYATLRNFPDISTPSRPTPSRVLCSTCLPYAGKEGKRKRERKRETFYSPIPLGCAHLRQPPRVSWRNKELSGC